MGIKEKREARREALYSQFVSVKNLIEFIATDEDIHISDVAAELEGFFKKSDDSILPKYGAIDDDSIEFVPYPVEVSKSHLMGMLSDFIGCGNADASDHHGWLRSDIFRFLQEYEVAAPVYLPAWRQQEYLSMIDNNQMVDRAAEDEWLDHPNFPVELSIAITAWHAAVNNSEGSGERPGEFIRKWLAKNNPELKEEAKKRIATVANWEKLGGRAKKIQ